MDFYKPSFEVSGWKDIPVPSCWQVLGYVPRQGGNGNGRVENYEFYLSADGKHWGEPVAKGACKGKDKAETVKLAKPVPGRYLKLVALSEATGQKYASVAELDVVDAK